MLIGTTERYEIDITSNELLQEIRELKQKTIILSELTEEQFQAIHFARQKPDQLIWDVISDWYNTKYNIILSRRALADRYKRALKKYIDKVNILFEPKGIPDMKEFKLDMVGDVSDLVLKADKV